MQTKFLHRVNADGTINSICHQCFRTIANVRDQTGLEQLEREHICDPKDIMHWHGDPHGR